MEKGFGIRKVEYILRVYLFLLVCLLIFLSSCSYQTSAIQAEADDDVSTTLQDEPTPPAKRPKRQAQKLTSNTSGDQANALEKKKKDALTDLTVQKKRLIHMEKFDPSVKQQLKEKALAEKQQKVKKKEDHTTEHKAVAATESHQTEKKVETLAKKTPSSKPAIAKTTPANSNAIKIDAPLIAQMPELPRGCEVTSLAMLLQYSGIKVSKMTLAKQIKKDPTPYRVKNGKVYFGNPNNGFVGDMYSFKRPGLGVFHGPVFQLAKRYLPKAVDITGKGWNTVEKYLKSGHPVWVLTTSWFRRVPDKYWRTWYTPSGPIRITYHEHSVLVTGFDNNYVYFNDPLAVIKNRHIKKISFIAGWKQYGMQAISY